MITNILLINPWIYDFAAYDFWIKPLGLLYLGAVLKKNQYHINYIDCLDLSDPLMQEYLRQQHFSLKRKPDGSGKFYKIQTKKPVCLKDIPRRYGRYGITLEIFKQRLDQLPRPEAVLITSLMTYWYPGAAKVIELIRDYDHSIPIILGGKLPTLCPDTAKSLGADFLVSGEGELKILELMQGITGQSPIYVPDLANLDTLPYPAFDLLKRVDWLPLQTSRGCPFHCVYCASNLLSPKPRRRSVANVIQEIEYSIKTYHVRQMVFYDDALCYRANDYLMPILRAVEAKMWPINFHTPNAIHAREITPELAKLFYNTGFKTIRLGFETSDPGQQKITGGKVTNEELKTAVLNLHQAGFSREQIGVYILAGLPRQRKTEVEETINFVLASGALPLLTEFSPIPNTLIWPECIENSPYDLAKDPLWHNNSIMPCQWEEFSWEDYLQLKLNARMYS